MEKCVKEVDIKLLQEHNKNIYQHLARHDEEIKIISDKTNQQFELSKAIALMAQQMGGISEDVKEVKTEVSEVKKDVGTLKEKVQADKQKDLEEDANNWRKYKWYVLLTLTGLFIGYFFSTITGG